MEAIGFILLGILLGACLISLISLWIYHQSCPNYIERETGVIWHLKTVAADAFSGKAVFKRDLCLSTASIPLHTLAYTEY